MTDDARTADDLEQRIARLVAEQYYAKYMCDLYERCRRLAEEVSRELELLAEANKRLGEIELGLYKIRCSKQTIINIGTMVAEFIATFGLSGIAHAAKLAALGKGLLAAFKVLDVIGNLNSIRELGGDITNILGNYIPDLDFGKQQEFLDRVKRAVEEVFKEKFETEIKHLGSNLKYVVCQFYTHQSADTDPQYSSLGWVCLGMRMDEAPRVAAIIRDARVETDKMIANQGVWAQLTKNTPGPSLWAIIAGSSPVDHGQVALGFQAITKLVFAQVCQNMLDHIGNAATGLMGRYKTAEATYFAEKERVRSQTAILMPLWKEARDKARSAQTGRR